MDKIEYSIVSRGELRIQFKGKVFKITGELIFKPPKFYADIVSLSKISKLNEEDKKQIIEFIQKDSFEKIGTEIIFD